MFDRFLLKSIRYDESVLHTYRPSFLHYRWPMVIFLGLSLGSIFLWYPLQTLGIAGWIVFFIVFFLGLTGLIRTIIIWQLNIFIVTSRRIIDKDQPKLFEKHVAECLLDNIQDIRYNKKGLVATLFNIGTVIVDSASPRGHIELVNVFKPESVKEQLMQVQQNHTKNIDETQEI